jgi:hypothetical protein
MGDKSNTQKLILCTVRWLGLLSRREDYFQLHPVLCGLAVAEYHHGECKHAYDESR